MKQKGPFSIRNEHDFRPGGGERRENLGTKAAGMKIL